MAVALFIYYPQYRSCLHFCSALYMKYSVMTPQHCENLPFITHVKAYNSLNLVLSHVFLLSCDQIAS